MSYVFYAKMDNNNRGKAANRASINRRQVLKGTAYTGALVGGVSISSKNTLGRSQPAGDILEMTAPFVSISLTVPAPKDAIKIDGNPRFPATIETESGVYLPQGPSSIFEDGTSGVVVETPSRITQVESGDVITQNSISTVASSDDGNSLLVESSISDSIRLQSVGDALTIQFGSEELQIQKSEQVSHTRRVELTYQTLNGKESETVDITLSATYNGNIDIKSHEDLIVIPKNSEGGQHIKREMKPKIEKTGRVGSWTNVVEMNSINAWGIELEENGGDDK